MVKYFTTGLQSKLLRYLQILSPFKKNLSLDELKKMWRYCAEKFPNVISGFEIDMLMSELVPYKQLDDPEEDIEVDAWFSRLALLKCDGENHFPVITKLGLALCTMYNSSSEAERDFSRQNYITADPRRNRMEQPTIRSKLAVMSAAADLKRSCKRCLDAKSTPKKGSAECDYFEESTSRHCHCSLLPVDQKVLDTIKAGQPRQKYEVHLTKSREVNRELEMKREERKEQEEQNTRVDLKEQIKRFKMQIQNEAVKRIKDEKTLQETTKRKQQPTLNDWLGSASGEPLKENKSKKRAKLDERVSTQGSKTASKAAKE